MTNEYPKGYNMFAMSKIDFSRLGDVIRHLRKQKGLSVWDACRKSGIPMPNWYRIERGANFNITTLEKLAVGLDVQPWEILKLAQKGEEKNGKA